MQVSSGYVNIQFGTIVITINMASIFVPTFNIPFSLSDSKYILHMNYHSVDINDHFQLQL